MKTLEIKGMTGCSRIVINERLQVLRRYIPTDRTVIITDETVGALYGEAFPEGEVIRIPTGERIKDLTTVQAVYEKMMLAGADRSTFVVGIGGGIVCDVTGFVASTYMRGLRFGFVPTSLLAQVDASVGGKNGVNFHGYKNLVGCFNQPEFVLCDMALLRTLPEREIQCGFGEIAKHAFIGDARLLEYLERNTGKALRLDQEVIERLVHDSIAIKAEIVNRDEKERGERKKLNFGHTIGHAIEKTTDVFRHGEAISVGMVVASNLSVRKGLLPSQDARRIRSLLLKMGLPVHIEMDKQEIVSAIKKDKKKAGDEIDFVLLEAIGRPVLEKISIRELDEILVDW